MACEQADLPAPARKALNLLADQLVDTQKKIEGLTADIRADARANEAAQRLQGLCPFPPQTIPRMVCRVPRIGAHSPASDRLPRARWFQRCLISQISSQAETVRGENCPPDSFLFPLTLAGSDATAALDGRQGTVGAHFQDGQQISAQAPVPGRYGTSQRTSCRRHASSMTTGRGRRRLAVEDHEPQETRAGRDRPGQPHGAHGPRR